MSGLFLWLDNFLKYSISESALFLVCFAIITLAFIITIIFCLIPKKKAVKDWLNFLFLTVGLSLVQLSILIIANKNLAFALLFLSLCSFYFLIILNLSKRKVETKKERSFVKFIDEQIHNEYLEKDCLSQKEDISSNEDDNISLNQTVNLPKENLNDKPLKTDKKSDIDFTHVKNVLSRLDYFPLSSTDKKQVGELERAILKAEAGDNTKENKVKINDCLGALLKIMSKYGV